MYDLEHASIRYGASEPVLSGMCWSSSSRGVEVVFGGGGAGKSSLLRALAGACTVNMRREGVWRFRSDERGFQDGRPLPGVSWCGQPVQGFRPRQRIWPSVERALDRSVDCVLLDEPNAWVDETGYDGLIARIRARGRTACVLLSTHHVEFGRRCADRVVLLGGQRILVQGSAQDFFGEGAPRYAQDFKRDGNLVPKPKLAPPRGLRWVESARLGGMGWPGIVRPAEVELQSLADNGVTHLVTLTRARLEHPRPPDFGIEWHHCPIPDMGVPTMRAAMRLCGQVERWIDSGSSVVVHCRGGMGRTGLMLALVLVHRGSSARHAISTVRAANRHYIQTDGQLRFIERYEEAIRAP